MERHKQYGFVWQDRETGEFVSPVLWTRREQRLAMEGQVTDHLRLERVRVIACTER